LLPFSTRLSLALTFSPTSAVNVRLRFSFLPSACWLSSNPQRATFRTPALTTMAEEDTALPLADEEEVGLLLVGNEDVVVEAFVVLSFLLM
jgi:hypothetical protein